MRRRRSSSTSPRSRAWRTATTRRCSVPRGTSSSGTGRANNRNNGPAPLGAGPLFRHPQRTPMVTYIVRRILYSVPVLLISTFLSFTFVSLAGNPTLTLKQNPRFSQHTVDLIAARYHLSDPIPVRYAYWVKDVFTHKLGNSLTTLHPIWPDVTRAMGHTAQLIVLSEILALTLGVAVGIYSALRQYSLFDYSFTLFSFVGFAMPVFWLALLLQILFVDIYLKWDVRIFYTSGLNNPHHGAWTLDRLQHLGLPAITLCVISFAAYSRFMRAS